MPQTSRDSTRWRVPTLRLVTVVEAILFGLSALLGMAALVVCFLKAKYGTLIAAILVPVVGWLIGVVGAVRLAKPHSRWARRRYDEGKLRASRQRYGDAARTAV